MIFYNFVGYGSGAFEERSEDAGCVERGMKKIYEKTDSFYGIDYCITAGFSVKWVTEVFS